MRNLFFIACAAGIGLFIFWPTKEVLDRQIEYAQNTEPSPSPEQGNPHPETEAADLDPDPAETEKEIQEPIQEPEPEPEPAPQLTFEDVLNDRSKWPPAVRLVSPIELPVIIDGKEYGSRGLPPGTVATLDRMTEDGTLSLRVQGTAFQAHHEETNLMEQVIAAAEAAELRRVAEAEEKAKAEEAKQFIVDLIVGPEPIFARTTGWGGGSRPVKEYLKKNLKDPDSVEYIAWDGPSLVEVNENLYWAIYVKYRARNSFGGMVVEEGHALVRHHQVVDFVQK